MPEHAPPGSGPPQWREALERIWAYCTERDWTGWDPYDGLRAERWPVHSLRGSRWGRLLLIQAVKHSPLNLRPLLGVTPSRNPKALALGLHSAVSLSKLGSWAERARPVVTTLTRDLLDCAVQTGHGIGWGYPFDWQSRVFFLPARTPTVVCTGFACRALDHALPLLDIDSPELAERARGAMHAATRFVLDDLHRSADADGFCWSYSASDRTQVVNASLLGAELVARFGARSGSRELIGELEPCVRWALARQDARGGWRYGQDRVQAWEDAFHTGFNLLSLRAIRDAARSLGLDAESLVPNEALKRGHEHYEKTFFDENGRPWYYAHSPWPIDTHALAVAVLTLLAQRDVDTGAVARADKVLAWGLSHLWRRAGYFGFQLHRLYRIDTPHMRWSEAWMLHALAERATVEAQPAAANAAQ